MSRSQLKGAGQGLPGNSQIFVLQVNPRRLQELLEGLLLVTGALAEAGLHILDMDTTVAGTEEKPIYIMQIEGHAAEGVEALQSALDVVAEKGIEAKLETIDTMVG